ncbi:MAG: N-acetylglucosamine kinase, partial [Bacteroidetes bacterium CG23_combo_of_CG06-09_8_20_14_all_32_9]
MILIADSGSTKTEWALVSKNHTEIFETTGMNPYFLTQPELEKILEHVNKKLKGDTVSKVVFFGAGCNSSEKMGLMKMLLKKSFLNCEIEVNSDLVGAAKALFGKNKGIAVILGTGANSGYFNGKEISFKTESLGYILGDEGSGAYLGKQFITKLLYNELPKEIENDFTKEYKIRKPEILENIYQKPNANRYLASFAVFIKKHIGNSEVKKIVKDAFNVHIVNHLL